MMRLFLAVFVGAFVCIFGDAAIAPNMVLGAYQDQFVKAWTETGIDTSACEGSIPKLGIGTQNCYRGAITDMAAKMQEASGDTGHEFESGDE